MSSFFLTIQKEFKNQSIKKDFDKKGKDTTFLFDTDDKEKNCMLTDMTFNNSIEGNIKRSIDLIYDNFDNLIKEKWEKITINF